MEENGVDALEPNKRGRPSMKKETKKIIVEGSRYRLKMNDYVEGMHI
ncbi:hypothetical protein SC499_25620 [Peribacillus simplex]|nr:hypothetical protein [Peribacillus simplex]MDW7617941.1 hypothetical protein [Peribacillus simplex]